MTSLEHRPHTALLVVDVQNDVMASAHDRDGVIARIADLVERARAVDLPVVWVQDHGGPAEIGSPGWQLVDELAPRDGEPRIDKTYGDSFAGTDLEDRLAELSVGHLVVTGAQTDACIRSTLHGALARGYDTTLVSDGHTTEDFRPHGSPMSPAESVAYANLSWSFAAGPEVTGEVVAAADVRF